MPDDEEVIMPPTHTGMILATKNDALWIEIGYTPDIEDGIGPVAIGERLVMVDENGDTWYIVCHPFSEIDGAWLEAYTSGDNPPIIILVDGIPDAWAQSKEIA